MDYWNYRIMKQVKDGETLYGLHEVHYANGKYYSWTKNSMIGYYYEPEEVVQVLKMMLEDTEKEQPVLDYDGEPEATLEECEAVELSELNKLMEESDASR